MTALIIAAVALHLASRLGYVVGVGRALSRQDRDGHFTARWGMPAGFERFRRGASQIMAADAVTFVLLALASHDTFPVRVALLMRIGVGAVLVAGGIGVKVWARNTLGADAYYWHNFFAPDDWTPPTTPGPYRYFRHPMYTVGYLHAWGFAVMTASLPALIAAAFDQATMLVFSHVVETPHYRRLVRMRQPGREP